MVCESSRRTLIADGDETILMVYVLMASKASMVQQESEHLDNRRLG